METIKPKFIEKNASTEPAEDFELLVARGVSLLQKLSGHKWTDYNIHDPGVTILEQLCYALTDLAYRTGFKLEDILTDEHGTIDKQQHSFFDKEKILTSNPVTINDYRKVILDEVDEVENVDLIPVISKYSPDFIKGLYWIFIRVSDHVVPRIEANPLVGEEITEKVRNCFLSYRNLSEDLVRSFVLLKPQKIAIKAKIIVKENVSPEEVLLNIHKEIKDLLSPKVRFYTEKELLDEGRKVEDIYCGPLLKHGIIPDDKLKPLATEIDSVELTGAILKVEGVLFVKELFINDQAGKESGKSFLLNERSFPLIDDTEFVKGIELIASDYKLSVKSNVFYEMLEKTNRFEAWEKKVSIRAAGDEKIKRGTYRNIGQYHSIQHNFPLVYGIGEEGLSSHESDARKAQAKQLKAYLLFFEQIMANYAKQLEGIGDLFSTNVEDLDERSYYYNPLYQVPGISSILLPPSGEQNWSEFIEDRNNPYERVLKNSQESIEVYRQRKNAILDHLYSRFNEKFVTYPVVLYDEFYGSPDHSDKAGLILRWKAQILKTLPETDYNKIRAFNYYNGGSEVSGFEKKMALHLHIHQPMKRELAGIFENGKIAFVSEKHHNQFRNPEDNSVKNARWEGKYFDVIATGDEIIELSEIGELIAGGINQNEAYIFRKQGISVLKHGINIKNYRIGPALNNEEGFIIIYKAPTADKWRIISRHPDRPAAVTALEKLISFLREISMESEGFHIMEHLLLRPELNNQEFGFKFFTKKEDRDKDLVIFENDTWSDFLTREKIIAKIINEALIAGGEKQRTEESDKEVYSFKMGRNNQSNSLEVVNTRDFHSLDSKIYGVGVKNMTAELLAYEENKTRFYPRFQMQVRLSDGKIIKEDFYNYRITVVLPSWPARFQEPEFRAFTEDLFRSGAPAYLRIKFLWLGVTEMKKFENLYFPWLKAFNTHAAYEERHRFSEKLALYLGKDFLIRAS